MGFRMATAKRYRRGMTTQVVAPGGRRPRTAHGLIREEFTRSPSALIAQEIRAELGRQRLSNRQFAMMLGVSPMWVNRRVSTGDTEITANDVQRIADALGVSAIRLLSGWLPRLDSNQQPAGYRIERAGYVSRLATAA